MEIMRASFISFIFAVLICMPSLSYSDVKVTLTNGREIVADTCEDEGGQLVCTKMGGTFNIEKKDVGSIRQIKSRGSETPSAEPASPPPTEPEKKTDDAPGDNRPDKEGLSAGAEAGAMKRLEEIMQRKRELSSGREMLLKEREQLVEDLKKAPDWMPTDKYADMNKRNDELTEKIKLFNEEAGRLNEEEKRIVEGLKKKD
jgi:hypothetical protein